MRAPLLVHTFGAHAVLMRKNGLQILKAVVRAEMQKKENVTSTFMSWFNDSTNIKHFSDLLKEYQGYTLFLTTWEPSEIPSLKKIQKQNYANSS